MTIKYKGKLDANDLQIFQLASLFYGGSNFLPIFVIFFFSFLYLLLSDKIEMSLTTFVFTGFVVFFGLKYLTLLRNTAQNQEFHITINKKGIFSKTPGFANTTFEWNSFKWSVDVKNRLLLFFENNCALIIPKRLLSSGEEWQQLKEFVADRVPKKEFSIQKPTNNRLLVIILVALLFLPFLFSITSKSHDSKITNDEDKLIFLEEDDPRVIKAKNQAQASLDYFIDQSQNRKVGYTYSVKTVIGEAEHIWVQVDYYNDGIFQGRLANEPIMEGVKMGDRIEVMKNNVEDWTIRDDNWNIVGGGFSIKLLQEELPQ